MNDALPLIAEVRVPGSYEVQWYRTKSGYTVIYGEEVKCFQRADDVGASEFFGHCVRHALECAGMLHPG